jgi:hypothetical protein
MKTATQLLALLFACLISLQIANAQTDSIKSFIFGHSLLDHRPPLNPTPSDETTVPHWLYLLAKDAGNYYASSGQYGFLPQHANLPPFSQWGYDSVPGVWESDTEPFGDADFTTLIITAGNFIQYQAPNIDYYNSPGVTPLNTTHSIIDWAHSNEDNLRVYIYENWPDMGGFLSNNFPPSADELDTYNDYTVGEFHDWWLEYHDSLIIDFPNLKMIPVGPILKHLLTNTNLSGIAVTDLYEDDAPHGMPTIYFLAGLITYMAIYEEQAPTNYNVPDIVHPLVESNYLTVVSEIWSELNAFNYQNGDSRVFFDVVTSTKTTYSKTAIDIYPNPSSTYIYFSNNLKLKHLKIFNQIGQPVVELILDSKQNYLSIENLDQGLYYLLFKDENNLEYKSHLLITR